MKLAPLLALAILVLLGCASTAPPPEPVAVECRSDEFRGEGATLADAQSALARQINSSVNVTIERVVSQQISNGKEDLSSGYESKTIIESSLPNAHDARIVSSTKTGVAICMSKTDAAKGFIERQRLIYDSLGFASNTVLSTEHPKQKNEAWRKTRILQSDFVRIQYLLEGWGVKSPYLAEEAYSKAREDYKAYCQNMKVFWQDAGNECSATIFALLSKKIKIEKSQCASGLSLNLSCAERCKSSPYGAECIYEPSLSVKACGGESYSLLKANAPVAGGDMHSEAKARENLAENLSRAVFLGDWEKELKKWVPQCTN